VTCSDRDDRGRELCDRPDQPLTMFHRSAARSP